MISARRVAQCCAVAAAVSVAAAGCHSGVDPHALAGDAACAALDSLLASAGPARPFVMQGDAVLDVEQFRFRGQFRLETAASGDVTMELGGSTLFGGHREDVVVSLVGDTLRVFDRERGRFYEGADLDTLIDDATDAHADWTAVVAHVLALPARCDGIAGLTRDDDGARGRNARGSFRLVTEGGRLTRATWPDPVDGSTFDDRLDVRYRWEGARLDEITAGLPTRGWRVRLSDNK